MKIIKVESEIKVFGKINELPKQYQVLVKKAKEASENAYAPYSKFKVGAAVLLKNNKIIAGNNQENASYPVGQCAEGVAMFSASAQYPDVSVKAIAVHAFSGKKKHNEPVAPCGNCRQVIAEYEMKSGNEIEIILSGSSGKIYIAKSVKILLPLAFTSSDIKH